MTDNLRAIAATVAGAVMGGVAGYLVFTEHGRSLRRQLEATLDDLAHELNGFRHTIEKAAGVASEGWKLLNEALDESGPPPRYPTPHQSSPF